MDENNQNRNIDDLEIDYNHAKTIHKYFNKKAGLYVLVVIFSVLILLVVGFSFYRSINSSNENSVATCSERAEGSILFKAESVFGDELSISKEKLDMLIQDIKKIDDYESDANCFYPVIYSYIYENNFVAANEKYEAFASVYGDGDGFADDIYPLQNLEDLKSLIDFSLEIQNTNTVVPTVENVDGAGDPINDITEEEFNR